MSRKHNTKHNRSASNYPLRLRDRGESTSSVRMQFFDRKGRSFDTIDAVVRRDAEQDDRS